MGRKTAHSDFLRKVRDTIEKYGLLEKGDGVLVGLSGGQDSVALCHVLLQLAPSLSLRIEAAHFNHGIRGAEGDRDQAFVEELCRNWGIHLETGRGDVPALAAKRGRGIEEAAREARYAFLKGVLVSRGLRGLALAHTLSDAVETFLMRLIKGASPYGLRGILPKRGEVIRPLVEVTREEVQIYCEAQGLPYVEDSSNCDVSHFRNWVRWRLLPLLKERNPKVEEALARFMEILKEENQVLEEEALSILKNMPLEEDGMPKASLGHLPPGLRRRVLLDFIHGMGGDAYWGHLKGLERLVEGQGAKEIHLPGGLKAIREGEHIRFTRSNADVRRCEAEEVLVFCPGLYAIGDYLFSFVELGASGGVVARTPWSLLLDQDKVEFPLIIRYKRPGDKMFIQKVGHRKLQDIFVDAKVPGRERQRRPVLAECKGRVIWIPGLRWDARIVANGGTRRFLLVTVKGVI